ncbi:Arginase/deacetylase [Lophiostoma macrostomum CBS 122681]|uniref:Arginase/deacetylase n=1 Tax=Lophiostoma macrostomum CBS 122681 TaxID=1314788 RepID=A0A6A6STS4_9PLEO|nr:Arginase/deacetylase [Lophiostoma macrostomum CBS 122681]
MSPATVQIINIPSDIGSIYAGKSRAPAAFKSKGLVPKLEKSGSMVKEHEAVSTSSAGWKKSSRLPNGARNEVATVDACKEVMKTIYEQLKEQPDFQLIIGGECLYCPAILSAYSKAFPNKRIGLVYIDADCDLYTPDDTNSSGNIAGMTLTHLTLRNGALDGMKQFSRDDGSAVIDNSNIVLFGLNTASEANKREHLGYLFDNNFHVVTSSAVQNAPVTKAREALRWLEERVDHIIIHLDVDVIDPGEFPLCNVPNWTGLGFEECMAALKVFLKSEKAVALSVAEVNPDHDPGLEMTGRLVDEIVEGLSAI